jgi:hypothetical protein
MKSICCSSRALSACPLNSLMPMIKWRLWGLMWSVIEWDLPLESDKTQCAGVTLLFSSYLGVLTNILSDANLIV